MESTGTEADSKAESLDGTSPHKDTGLLGGGMPTATVPKEGYLANQQITGTDIASPKKLTMTSSISLVGSTLSLKILAIILLMLTQIDRTSVRHSWRAA